MIKIIKKGKTKFTGICKTCGCEFEYELKDLEYGKLKCPCCEQDFYHPNQVVEEKIDLGKLYFDIGKWNPCKDCYFHKRLESGEIYIGDTPCTWCKHMQPHYEGGIDILNNNFNSIKSENIIRDPNFYKGE